MEENKEQSKEQLWRKERGQKAKEFLQCEFFTRFLLPYVERERLGGYPNPSEEGWENKYRMAFAKDEVFTHLFTSIKSWQNEFEAILKEEKEVKKDIIDA